MTTSVTQNDIHHFTAQAKMALISKKFAGDCFDFYGLSASSLGGLAQAIETGFHSQEDCPSCIFISTQRRIFKKITRPILSTPAHSEILFIDFRSKYTYCFRCNHGL